MIVRPIQHQAASMQYASYNKGMGGAFDLPMQLTIKNTVQQCTMTIVQHTKALYSALSSFLVCFHLVLNKSRPSSGVLDSDHFHLIIVAIYLPWSFVK